MMPVYLICGVSGSGKTWVCNQVTERFNYVPNDNYIGSSVPYHEILFHHAKDSSLPVLADCPFGERVLRENLERLKLKVIPIFIVEAPDIVRARYEKRTGRMIPKAALTRAHTIIERVNEWNALYGTAEEVLLALKNMELEDGKPSHSTT